MKLEVGMLVRTYKGIAKIIDFEAQTILIRLDKRIMTDNLPEYINYATEEDITKASHNIIDLIQVGDYVNGQKVFDKLYDELNKCWYLKLEIGEVFGKYERTYQQHIKSIVTKEQMEAMEYKVGE